MLFDILSKLVWYMCIELNQKDDTILCLKNIIFNYKLRFT